MRTHGGVMDFRILGPIEVVTVGDVTPTAPKLCQVLALLLLRRNSIVQVSEFVDELWGENPPPSALSTLQTYIYKLRKVLSVGQPGGGEETLRSKPSGYLLSIPDEYVDLGRYERLAHEGKAALEGGEHERGGRLLNEALGLWRGPALAG